MVAHFAEVGIGIKHSSTMRTSSTLAYSRLLFIDGCIIDKRLFHWLHLTLGGQWILGSFVSHKTTNFS